MGQEQTSPVRGVYQNSLTQGEFAAIPARNISLATCKHYGVTVRGDKHSLSILRRVQLSRS